MITGCINSSGADRLPGYVVHSLRTVQEPRMPEMPVTAAGCMDAAHQRVSLRCCCLDAIVDSVGASCMPLWERGDSAREGDRLALGVKFEFKALVII